MEEISDQERFYEDGSDPVLLDIIEIRFIEPRPTDFQSENHLIDAGSTWRKVGHVGWKEAEAALDSATGSLWINGYARSHGPNDRVPEALAKGLGSSLFLIRPTNLNIAVAVEGARFGNPRRRHRARFEFDNAPYRLSVTDPYIADHYPQDGDYPIPGAILCVSLALYDDGFAYKLVAGVLTPERVRA